MRKSRVAGRSPEVSVSVFFRGGHRRSDLEKIPSKWGGFGGHGVHPCVVLCAFSGSPVVARKELAGARGEGRRKVLAVTGSVGTSFSLVFVRVQRSSVLGPGRRRRRPWARIPAEAWPFSFYFCLS